MSNIFIGLKKTCLGVLERGERDKYNETCLKEGGCIKILTTVLHSRCSLLRFVNTHLRQLQTMYTSTRRTQTFHVLTKTHGRGLCTPVAIGTSLV